MLETVLQHCIIRRHVLLLFLLGIIEFIRQSETRGQESFAFFWRISDVFILNFSHCAHFNLRCPCRPGMVRVQASREQWPSIALSYKNEGQKRHQRHLSRFLMSSTLFRHTFTLTPHSHHT
jgi:hypothetical protein